MPQRLLLLSLVAAHSVSCSRDFEICDENRIERDGECFAPCASLEDCTESEGCIDGACLPTDGFLPPTGLILSFDDEEIVNLQDFATLRGDCTLGLPVRVEAPSGEVETLSCPDGRFEYTTPTESTDGTRTYRATQVASRSLSVTDTAIWTRATSALASCVVTPPEDLTAENEGTAVRLRWSQLDGDHDFALIERRTPGGSWGALQEVPATQLDYLDSAASPDSQYEYRVREIALVFEQRCEGDATPAVGILTLPAAPSNFVVEFAGGIRLSWVDPNAFAQSIVLERSVADGPWEALPATESPFLDLPPASNLTIDYRVAAVNPSGRGPWNLVAVTIGAEPTLSWSGPVRLGPMCELEVPGLAEGEGLGPSYAQINRDTEELTASLTGVSATLTDLSPGDFTIDWEMNDEQGFSVSLTKNVSLSRTSIVRQQADDVGLFGDFDFSEGAQPINPGCSECSGRRASLVAGDGFVCALGPGGEVDCWGDNREFQLGPGIPGLVVNPIRACLDSACAEPLTISADQSSVDVASMLARTSCVPLGPGSFLHCWGQSSYSGELGNGEASSTAMRPAPVCLAHELPGCVPLGSVVDLADRDGVEPARCAVVDSGEVYCWGNNADDLVLNSGDYSVLRATRVCASGSDATGDCVPLMNVAEILIGTHHRCARHTDGTVSCWGWNDVGQLGSGGTEFAVFPPRPVCASGVVWNGNQCGSSDERLANVQNLSGGDDHTCALLDDGAVECWGANTAEGFLGDGTDTDRPSPGPVCASGVSDGETCVGGTPLNGVAKLSSSLQSHCAILSDGTARCWGSNFYGELGNGNTDESLLPRPLCADRLFDGATVLPACALGPMTELRSVSLSRTNGCAVREPDGAVWCWGYGRYSALGAGEPTTDDRFLPAPVCRTGRLSDGSCVQLSGQQRAWVSGQRGMSVSTDGRVVVWGQTRAEPGGAVLGVEPPLIQPKPSRVQRLRTGPFSTETFRGAVALAAGSDHVCALDASGVLSCWGNNDWGQLGFGDFETTGTPRVVCDENSLSRCASEGPPMSRFVQISANAQGTCAVDDLGRVWCWGSNDAGQLGAALDPGAVPYSATPVLVRCGEAADDTGCLNPEEPLDEVVSVSVGGSHSCALRRSGEAFCWGRGNDGQLGNGATLDADTPRRVELASPALQIVSVGRASCALGVDSGVDCWGTNDFSELGVGDNYVFLARSAQPVPVCASGKLGQDCTPLEGIIALSGFDNTFCALEESGGIRCWGHGFGGKLGDGITSFSHEASNPKSPCAPSPNTASCDVSPVCDATLTPAMVTVAVGGDVGCAMNESGEVLCWGAQTASRGLVEREDTCRPGDVCPGGDCGVRALRICDEIALSE